MGEAIEIERAHRLNKARSFPEGQCPAERKLPIERDRIVGQRGVGPLDPAGIGPQQPRDQTDQARLAATIRPGEMQCLAGVQLDIQILEQQSPAAHQRQPFALQEPAHARSSSACMSSSLRPK